MASDIEDITTKTGNYKKFQVFVKMVATALQQTSESVVMDLLTYADLEMLKARKMGQERNINSNTSGYVSKW
jgi:coiled-coil domain-containing protein 61